MYIFTALLATLGGVGYLILYKDSDPTIHPLVSVLGIYLAVTCITMIALLVFPIKEGISVHIHQLNYTQLVIAICIFMMEIGFLLMYRSGWSLSTGNLVTGVFVNIILVVLGIFFLREKINWINLVGIILSILGVAMISYHR